MKHLLRLPLRACLGCVFLLGHTSAIGTADPNPPTQPTELTAGDFFRPAEILSARLNPAGTHLAYLAYEPDTDSTGLRVLNLETKRAVGLPGSKIYDLRQFHWVGDERIVFTVTRDNLYATGLFITHRDLGRRPEILNGRDAVEVLGSPEARPDNLLVWVRQSSRDRGRPGSLVEINLRRKSEKGFDEDSRMISSTIQPPPGESVRAWLPDHAGEIRYAVSHQDGKFSLYRREVDKSWTRLILNLDVTDPLAVDTNPDVLLVARLTPDGSRELVRLNTRDGTSGPVLYTDEKYDFGVGRIQFSDDTKEPLMLTYARQAPVQLPLVAREAVLQKAIDAALPSGRINLIVSRSRDGARLLVRSSSDRHPGTLYLLEPKAGRVIPIANLAPWLPETRLAPVRITSYEARDGLQLDAYVTLPHGFAEGKPAPMIVLPHGGPWVRDQWGYDPVSQFFASRGYVVFRPNYRGSAGYHAGISLKPRMEFRQMHDDVTDGVQAMIQAGIADSRHIAIVGGSFGGYLAVCGAAFEPDLYRCAVTKAGVFDWEQALRDARRNDSDSFRYDYLLNRLGDPKADREKFEAMSPLRAADRIRIPIFVSHGGEDKTADADQSHRLVKALRQTGTPVETMFERWEGHGFYTLKNRVELYERIEAFLKQHI